MGIAPYVVGLPGIRAAKTATQKIVFRGGYIPDILPAGKVINGTISRDPTNTDLTTTLQPGLIMGKITSSGLYAPSIMGVNTVAVAVGATSITAAAATVTELVRRVGSSGTFKLTGPPTASGTVVTETITYSAASSTTITCTATVNAFVISSLIQPTDGSETPITFIPDGYGIPVVDQDGTVVSSIQFPEIPIDGIVDTAQMINWPADTSTAAWLISRLNNSGGGQFVFSSRY